MNGPHGALMGQGRRLRVREQVQGVGFRPFHLVLADEMGRWRRVPNAPEGVLIEVAGPDPDAVVAVLQTRAQPHARVDVVEFIPFSFDHRPQGFVIAATEGL